MTDLPPEVEQQLASMSDVEFSSLTARLRAPDSAEALRTAASQLLSGDALNAFVTGADPSKFTGADGQVDQQKVQANIQAVYGITGHQQPNQGQHSGGMAPGLRPGDRGKAAAAKRFGTPADPETAAATGRVAGGRGEAGRAAAAKRFAPQPQQES